MSTDRARPRARHWTVIPSTHSKQHHALAPRGCSKQANKIRQGSCHRGSYHQAGETKPQAETTPRAGKEERSMQRPLQGEDRESLSRRPPEQKPEGREPARRRAGRSKHRGLEATYSTIPHRTQMCTNVGVCIQTSTVHT